MSGISLFLIAIFTLSCEKEEDCCTPLEAEEDRTLIFGTYFGFCLGDCTHLFKIEKGEVFPDQGIERLNVNEALTFSAVPLSIEDYNKAKTLLDNFPEPLLDEEETTIGIPDAYDQGGIFLQLTENETVRSWYLDSNIEALPKYLRAYATMVKEVTTKLRKE